MGTFQTFEFASFFTSLIQILECIRPTGPTGFSLGNGIISEKEDKGTKLSLDLWCGRNLDCRQVLRSENKSPILCKII